MRSPAATAGKAAALPLFAGLAEGYERRAAVLSLGQVPRWKRFLVDRLPVGPEDHVLDVATGTAAVAAELVCVAGEAPCLEPSSLAGYRVDEAEVTFWGLCPDCRPDV